MDLAGTDKNEQGSMNKNFIYLNSLINKNLQSQWAYFKNPTKKRSGNKVRSGQKR